MADQDLQGDVRAKLEEEQSHLRAQLEELSTDSSDRLEYDENFADSAQVAAEMGENRTLAGSLREQLTEVDRALERLDQGTYGICANCGNVIDPSRLEAMPGSTLCINCA